MREEQARTMKCNMVNIAGKSATQSDSQASAGATSIPKANFTIPFEIRYMIYSELLTEGHFEILRVSKEVHQEAAQSIYKHRTLRLYAESIKSVPLTPEAASKIRQVEIRIKLDEEPSISDILGPRSSIAKTQSGNLNTQSSTLDLVAGVAASSMPRRSCNILVENIKLDWYYQIYARDYTVGAPSMAIPGASQKGYQIDHPAWKSISRLSGFGIVRLNVDVQHYINRDRGHGLEHRCSELERGAEIRMEHFLKVVAIILMPWLGVGQICGEGNKAWLEFHPLDHANEEIRRSFRWTA